VLADLKAYFKGHRQKEWTAELSQYVSFALSWMRPRLQVPLQTGELPPDASLLQGFRACSCGSTRKRISRGLWQKAQPAFEEAIARYHLPATASVTEVNAYLRGSTNPALGTRFQIYVDLLGAPNQIQTRSYKNEYFVVLTPSPAPLADDIRHGYLHYQLDPLAVPLCARAQ